MKSLLSAVCALSLISTSSPAPAQNPPSPTAAVPSAGQAPVADYPANRTGVLIHGSHWAPLANQFPAKTRVAHGLAAGLSYGLAPAKLVAEFDGEHAATQVESPQPVICVCRFHSIPGTPVLVRLHPKKGARELDGGRMTVYPVVGGSKMADANKSDIIPADVSQPDPQTWLIRPQSPLDPGEYALMLGTQNMNIYPFTVAAPSPQPPSAN